MLVNHNYQSGFNKWNGIGKILKYYMLTHNLQFKDENDVFQRPGVTITSSV